MKALTTIEALEGAIEMLMEIRCGGAFSDAEFERRLAAYKRARDKHHVLQMQDERRRTQIRELAAEARTRRAP